MIAINILINDLLNYNCDRYLPTQLQGGVGRNLWHHLSMFHTLLLTTSQFEMCAVIPNVVHIGMLFQLDLTPFVTVMSSFNFRRPYIWLMRLVFVVSIPSDNGIKQIISLTSAPPSRLIVLSEACCAVSLRQSTLMDIMASHLTRNTYITYITSTIALEGIGSKHYFVKGYHGIDEIWGALRVRRAFARTRSGRLD